MKETVCLRVSDKKVKKHIRRAMPSLRDRVSLGFDSFVSVIELPRADPRVEKIISICKRHTRKRPRLVVDKSNWACRVLDEIAEALAPPSGRRPHKYYDATLTRGYSASEIREAGLFSIEGYYCDPDDNVETRYDLSGMCESCGHGRVQQEDMVANLRKFPRSKDIVRTYGGDEWVVSEKLARLMREKQITGCSLRPVHHRTSQLKDPPRWYQLTVHGKAGSVLPPTLFGTDPWDLDDERDFVCERHDVAGLGLLSQVHLSGDEWDGSDIAGTATLYGHRLSPHVPRPIIVISKRFYDLLMRHKIKGFKAEPVKLPDSFQIGQPPGRPFDPRGFACLDQEESVLPIDETGLVKLDELLADTSTRYDKLLKVTGKRPGATAAEVATAEKEMGLSLPDSYKKLLLKWNGVAFLGEKVQLLPIGDLGGSLSEEDGIPSGMVVFGSDEYGNWFLFDTGTVRDGEYTVAEMDHETGVVGGLGQTFQEWIESLCAEHTQG